jgi:hypothetical protein
MADPLRDAFRSELAAVVLAAAIPWGVVDTINTTAAPTAATSFITLRFAPALPETQYTFGSPGSNFWLERGDVFIDLFPKLGIGHGLVESYGLAIRNAFRNRRFVLSTGQYVRILSVAPMSGGPVDGAWWCETVAVNYRVFNIA